MNAIVGDSFVLSFVGARARALLGVRVGLSREHGVHETRTERRQRREFVRGSVEESAPWHLPDASVRASDDTFVRGNVLVLVIAVQIERANGVVRLREQRARLRGNGSADDGGASREPSRHGRAVDVHVVARTRFSFVS